MWLISNVNGDARELIHTCARTDEETGLKEAIALEENYGEDDMIASQYLDKLRNGQKITEFDF